MPKLTRVGAIGLELTREEVCDLIGMVGAVIAKAQCREVNCDVLDSLAGVDKTLKETYNQITNILEYE